MRQLFPKKLRLRCAVACQREGDHGVDQSGRYALASKVLE